MRDSSCPPLASFRWRCVRGPVLRCKPGVARRWVGRVHSGRRETIVRRMGAHL